jgi:hypothetical protein
LNIQYLQKNQLTEHGGRSLQDAFALGTGADNVGHMQFEAGKTYKVSFDARASVSGAITLAIGHSQPNWTPYHVTENLIVTTETQNFVIEFTLAAEGNFNTLAQFKLEMGLLFGSQTAPQYFILDNVLIEEKVGETFVATNLIVNGTMDDESEGPELTESLFYSTGFEGAAKTSYAAGDVEIDGQNWNLNQALIGNLADDKKNGLVSIRGRQISQTEAGTATMLFDIVGASKVTFSYANYGSLTDGRMSLWISNNSGTTWTQIWVQTEAQATLATVDVIIDYNNLEGIVFGDSVRFEFRFAGTTSTQNNSRLNLDDVMVYILS